MSLTPLDAVGQVLSGTYQVERKIAAGGMGVVYEAKHVRLPRRFAIKVLGKPGEDVDSAIALERFKREAQVASALKNPHVVQIYDYQIAEGGFPYIVMELLEGEDLAHRIRKSAPLTPALVVQIVSQIADALDAAHAMGIIHRDLKPANVFLNTLPKPDFVKVLDFGVSKMADWVTITRTDALVGTPLYMSPEQAAGVGDMTSVSDVFSLGAIAYEMLCGSRAFAGKSIPAILYQVVHTDPSPVSKMLPPSARDVDAVFAQALAKDRRLRYQSAGRFARALELALAPLLGQASAEALSSVENSAQQTQVRLDAQPPVNELTGPPTPVQSPRNPFEEPTRLAATSQEELTRINQSNPPASAQSVVAHGEMLPQTNPRRSGVARLVMLAVAIVLAATAVTVGFRRGQADSTPRELTVVALPTPVDETPRRVRISVRTDPPGAEVFLDDEPIADGSALVAWRSEPRRLRVVAPGYLSAERTIDATSDRLVDVELRPSPTGPVAPPATPPRTHPTRPTRTVDVPRDEPRAPPKHTTKLAAPVQDL